MRKTESPLIAIFDSLVSLVFNHNNYQSFGALVIFCTVVVPAFGQTSVLTQHNDNGRTGQNTSETILNTTNVNVNQFGKLFAMPTDGQVYAQPLYVPGVTINGAVHNVVVIATENDSVYAYNADSGGTPLWKASMVDAAHGAGSGETALNSANTIGCTDMQPLIGITSTPVIDPASETIYVEAKSTNGTNYFHRLHALDLLTGNEKTPGPVLIDATVSGTGDGSSNGQLVFHNLALYQLNRPGLLLLNGTIYIAYASHCDSSPYHGWLFAYDAGTLTQKSVYVTTPNGGLGGFWMSGAGVAADTSGNIFIPSGNGDFDTTHVPAKETGDTILKFGTTNQILTLLDYFTPEEQSTLDSNDWDLGSGGLLLLPDQPGSFPHILVQAGKEGRIYVVNRDQMTTNNSHYCSGCPNDPEIIEESGILAVGAGGSGMFNSPAYWNNTLFFAGTSDWLKSIPITNGLPDFTHITQGARGFNFPGAGLSVSSNGTTAGSAILWAIDTSQYGSPGPGPGPAVLYAIDATNVASMLYSSAQNNRDRAGNAVKFAVPTIVNGKVYVGTSAEVDVYGLTGANLPPNISSITPSSATVGGPAFPLTINGTGFATGATVNFGSNPAITPTSVTSTQIVATVPAGDIATAGTVNVTVTNPSGGGTSNAQTFTVNNPAPTETSISPTSATAGGAGFTLTVNGTGFVFTSVVKFNGVVQTTTFVSATQLTAAITAADIATAGTASVTVTNPAPGGGVSGSLSFAISAVSAPTLTSITPAIAPVGGTAFTLTLTGTAFTIGATVNFGSNPAITPTSVTSTQIIATVPAGDIATAGTANVTVTNPSGGGTSNAQTFTVNNPAPTETSISPTSATAGGAGFTLTVNGTSFVSTSVVKFNGAAKTTAFVSGTQLTAAITAVDIASAGTATVTVTNPAPVGGTSAAQSFTINPVSAPTLASIAPGSGMVGGAAFTLTLTGTGFVAGATVNFGSNPAITPTSVTSTQIVATVPAGDIATAGTVNVTVTNPSGGGTSNAQTFTVNNPAPTETSISPTSATAGGAAFTLTINGTGFVFTSVVKFNGVVQTTTFVSATQLTAAITAADIVTAGTATVVVTNPPSGGTSSAVSFTINNAAPTVTSLSPTTATAGSAAFTLTVKGAGFVNGASVQFNGSSKATTFVSTTQIMAAILASDIAIAGTANVTVTNPAPTTGPSMPQVFTISSSENLVPTISSLGTTHAPGGASFTLTVNGTNFEAKSVVNFKGKPEATTFVSTTKLSAAIPASDVAVVGNMNITVTNPAPGGGTSTASPFTVDGYTISGPSGASLSPGQPAAIQITATPTANGFPNLISFSVSGLPAGSTASFNPATLTPNGNATLTTLTITDEGSAVSRRSASTDVHGTQSMPSPLLIWIATLLGWLYLRFQVRAVPVMKHYAAIALIAVMFLTGSMLSGCALSVNNSPSASTSQLTVTSTSGTLTQTFGITLTIAR